MSADRSPPGSARRILRAGALSAAAAAVVNEIIRWAAVAAMGVPAGFLPLQPGRPALFTVILLAAATVVMLVVARLSRRPGRLFRIVASVALLVSFLPDVALWANPNMPGTTGGTVLMLALMHVVAFAIAVPALVRAAQ